MKVLFLAGMHEFSLCSAVGSFGGGPKNLQRIVTDGTVPLLKRFKTWHGVRVATKAYMWVWEVVGL